MTIQRRTLKQDVSRRGRQLKVVLAVFEETAPRLLEHLRWLASHANFVRDLPHLFFQLVVDRIQKLVSHDDKLEEAETEQQEHSVTPNHKVNFHRMGRRFMEASPTDILVLELCEAGQAIGAVRSFAGGGRYGPR